MAMTSAVQDGKESRPVRARLVTAGILIAIFVLAMVIRCYWYYGPAVAPADTYGQYQYVVSGNDPDYHKRTIDYIMDNGRQLTWDPLMNYPNGGPNPNPPAFAWSAMLFGMASSPLFGFDVTQSVWMFFEILPAFWAALTIFPVYYFTRDMFGRKPAYLAAFFLAVMAGNVERTPLGFSDHDSYTMFFAVLGFFFLMRALKNLEEKNWVGKWRSPADISKGTLDFFGQNRVSVLYALLAGLSIGAVMLGWKGGTYIFAILFMYFLIHTWVKRFRREDPFGVAIVTLIAMGVPLLISFPYYYTMLFIHWYQTPFFVFLATVLLAVVVVVTREQPWMIVLGSLAVAVVAAYLALMTFFPAVYNVLLGFQGYFVRDKLYTTIAEAQPPDFSRMVYSYGEYVFYFALIAVVYSAWRLPKEHWRNDYIFTIMWCFMAIFMAMSAVRFMYNATPVFAILGGWVTWVIISLLDFKKMAKTYRGLNEGRWVPRWHAVKSSVKVRHVVGAIFIGYMVMGSATWYGIDAGIPYETKKEFDRDIYNFLPSQLRPASYDPAQSSLWWFGSFGTAFPSDYWTDGMFWFKTQDTNESPQDRPGFVAWWDYGHWCMHMGEHPSIADNFQQGVEISGSIITAQNESSVIAYYIARVAEPHVSDAPVKALLEHYLGKDTAQDVIDIELLKDLPKWRKEIIKHPDIFGKRTKDMNDNNAKWAAIQGLLASTLTSRQLVDLYDELTLATGHEIRYFAADTRMFPYTAQNTGIYYAPVKLSDQDINDFLTTKAVGNDGQEYDPANIPLAQRQDPEFRIVEYKLYYNAPFYNSFFYKAYIGYSPADAGIAPGAYGYVDVPTIVGNTMRTGQYPPMQGWNMSNFRLEYRTAYWNPYNESTGLANHSQDWKVVPPWTAQANQNAKNGVVDLFYRNLYGGVFFLKYYHGAFVNGTVRTETGKPMANVRVTVYDDLPLATTYYPGVPHGYAVTDSEGRYSLLAPYGNVTVKATNGGPGSVDDLLLLKESRELGTAVFYVSDEQAMRHELDLNKDGILDYNIVQDFSVNTSALNGRAYIDTDGDGAWTAGTDHPITGEVRAQNATLGLNFTAPVNAEGSYRLQNITPADYAITVIHEGYLADGGSTGLEPGANDTLDIKLGNFGVYGNVTHENQTAAANISIGLLAEGRVLYSNTSLANGSFAIPNVMPGIYNLSVLDEGYYRENIMLPVNQSDNVTIEMRAFPVYPVSGTTVPGAIVSFQNTENFARWVTVTADASGRYGANVSPGNYTVYTRALSGTGMLVNITDWMALRAPAVLDLALQAGIRINGTVYRDMNNNGTYDVVRPSTVPSPSGTPSEVPNLNLPEYQSGAGIEVEGFGARLFLPANSLGYYEAWLPAGLYTLRAFKNITETEAYVNVTQVDHSSPLTLNLSLGKGVQVTGKLYWDQNGDDVPDDREGAAGALLLFTDRKRPDHILEAHTAPNGSYGVFLPQITDYIVTMTGPGYENGSDFITTGTEPVQRDFKLEPRPTRFTARLTAGGKPAPAGVTGSILAISPGARSANLTTDAQGVLSGQLMPGFYTLRVEQNVTYPTGVANLSRFQPFNISLGPDRFELDVALELRVYVSGLAFFDENQDGVAQRTEYRNTQVKFVPEGIVPDPTASAAGIPSNSQVRMAATTEGRYEIALEPGNYTVWTHLPLPTPLGPDLVFISRVRIDRTTALNVPLEPGCNVRGTLYTDLNQNGRYDAGENRGGVGIAISAGGPALLTIASDPSGFYEMTLPQGRNFTLSVDNTTNETLTQDTFVPIRYVSSADLATPLEKILDQNISVARQIGVAGRVTYDRNQNGAADAGEGVPGAFVVFVNASKTEFTAVANATGEYSLFLAGAGYNLSVAAPGYNSSVKGTPSVNVTLEKREFQLALSAPNATVAFAVYPPGTYPADPRLSGGAQVTMRALDGRGLNLSGRTDVNGRLSVQVAPGVYSVLITSGSDVYFGPLAVEPSGGAIAVRLNLTPAVRLWGSASFNGTSGGIFRPGWVNLTINTTLALAGQNYTATLEFPGLPAVYEVRLPAGNFSADALYTTTEGPFNLTYTSSRALDIGPNETSLRWDIPLAKVKDHTIGLFWDEAQKATTPVNRTLNYTMLLSNFGNEKITVDLEVSKPAGWSVNLSLKKVELAPGENLTVTAGLTVPPDGNAGDNVVSINASSSALASKFFNVSRLMVHVTQFFGVKLETSKSAPAGVAGGVDYIFTLVNKGNGLDTFNLSVNGPYGWNITLGEYNPQLTGGESRDIRLTVQPFSGARIEKGLTVKVTAISKNEQTPGSELAVNLTFPRLSAGEVKSSGPGVSAPKAVPGFEALGLLAALALAAVAARRRWRQ